MVATRSGLAPRVLQQQLASSSSTVKGYNKRKREVLPPLGSTSDRPLEILCDEEEEQTERKLNLNPLSRLEALKRTHIKCDPQMSEQSKKMIRNVKSLLVSSLTSETTTDADDMVTFAIDAFTMLNGLGADYGCLYRDVKDLISKKYELQIEERKGDMLFFSALESKYEEVVILADDLEEDIKHIRGELEKEKEKMEHLKREIEEAEEEIRRRKQVIANIEHDVELLKRDEEKCKADLTNAQAEVEKLGTQVEAAKIVKEEIEHRKNAALQEIESISRRLLSTL